MDSKRSCEIGALSLIAALTSALAAGCMLEAWDGYRVEDRGAEIPFLGYHTTEEMGITIEAWDYDTGDWVPVADAVAEEPAEWEDALLYRWETSGQLDENFWSDSGLCTGFAARVRAVETETGRRLTTSREGGEECAAANPSLAEWSANCASTRTPVATILTDDAEPVPDITVDHNWLAIHPDCEYYTIKATGFLPASEGAEVLAEVRIRTTGEEVWFECDPLHEIWSGKFITLCDPPDVAPFNDPAWMSANQDIIDVRYRVAFECNYASTRYSATAFLPLSLDTASCDEPSEPPDPSEPPSGTTWSYTCNCLVVDCEDEDSDNVCDDPYEENPTTPIDYHASACFDSAAGSPPPGIGWVCEYAEDWVRLELGRVTECVLAPTPTEGESCSGVFGVPISPYVTPG